MPVYTANGVQCYLVSIATFFALAHFGYIRPAVVYDMFGELVSAMNLFSLLFVLMLTIKGLYFPSTKDSGTSGNFVIDYYWCGKVFFDDALVAYFGAECVTTFLVVCFSEWFLPCAGALSSTLASSVGT